MGLYNGALQCASVATRLPDVIRKCCTSFLVRLGETPMQGLTRGGRRFCGRSVLGGRTSA
eukprot:719284-Prymnesium_polylepis.1